MIFSKLHTKTKIVLIVLFLILSLFFGFLLAYTLNLLVPQEKKIDEISINNPKQTNASSTKAKIKKTETQKKISSPTNVRFEKEDLPEKKKDSIDENFSADSYVVGENLDEGLYKIVSTNQSSYFLIDKVKNKDKIDFSLGNLFFNFVYVDLKKGDYLYLLDAKLIKEKDNKPYKPSDDIYVSGQYKVGYDIPSGSYNISPLGQVGYIELSSSPSKKDVILSDYIEKPVKIDVKDGQYLTISMTDVKLGN